jgi:hypothetical protein
MSHVALNDTAPKRLHSPLTSIAAIITHYARGSAQGTRCAAAVNGELIVLHRARIRDFRHQQFQNPVDPGKAT